MPIDITQLQPTPPLQQSVMDPLTRLPAAGTLYFKSALTQQPKAVYVATDDAENPYRGVTQITLNNAGALPQPIYCYPFKETDAAQAELYDIVLMNDAGQTIFTRNNFPQASDTRNSNASTRIQNLCPSYGFNSPIHPHDFSEANGQAFNQAYPWCLQDAGTPIAYGWNLWAGSNVDYHLYYAFQEAAVTIPHNPQYECVVTVQNVQPRATSFVRLGCKLGAYNAFQGQALRLSHYLRWMNSAPFAPINILFVRTKKGVLERPVSLGTFTAGAVATLQQVAVNIPELPVSDGYTCDDVAYLFLDFPKGVDFKIGITANWYQIDSGSVVPFETAHAEKLSGAFFGSWTSIGDSCQHGDQAGLPTAFRQGRFSGLNKTGEIVTRLKGSDAPNYAIELTGGLYYWDAFVDDTGIKINRIAPLLASLDIQFTGDVAQPLFYSSLKNNVVDVGLKNGTFHADWDATAAPTITLAKSSSHNPYDITITKNSATEATIRYIYNWHPSEVIGAGWWCGAQPIAPINPGPIGNWYDNRCSVYPYGNRKVTATIIQHGDTDTPPEVQLTFTSTTIQDYASYFGISGRNYRYSGFIEIPTQEYPTLRARPYYDNISRAHPGSIHIFFTGDKTRRTYPGKRATLNISLENITTTEQLIDALIAKSGGGEAYRITVTALPTNGAVLRFSNNKYNYAVLFHQIGQSFPNKPTDVEQVLVMPFTSGMAVADFTKQLAVALQRFIIRIPKASDLGFDETDKKYTHWLTL